MKQNRVISTAVLFLLLGAAIPAFAQKEEEGKAGGAEKAQPAQHEAQPQQAQKAQPEQRAQKAQPQQRAQKAQPEQRAQKAQPEQRAQKAQPQERAQKAQPEQRAQKAQPQERAQKAQPQQRAQKAQPRAVASKSGGGHYGRISDVNYSAHFGRGHSFHVGHPQMIEGYNRFQYGGYWFGFNEGWPAGWDYNDDFYVEYIDGAYYLFNLRHPGFRLTLNIF
jgi:outer membrane biosynthesis protein TonB